MNYLKDTYRQKGKRRLLIEELKSKGITDELILNAFDKIPRHYFLDLAFEDQAYSNMAFQIGSGQTISHPYTVAFQTQLLEVSKGLKILEIGTGSGFQTCILCQLGAKVVTIERHRDLQMKAKKMLEFFNFNAKSFFGDGYRGKKEFGPFDRILVTCGAPEIPQSLLDQLKWDGIMIVPVGSGEDQKMLKIVRNKTDLKISEFGTFKFVPMLERTVK